MRSTIPLACAALALSVVTARAVPVAGAPTRSGSVLLISGGCGPFGHRGFDGECHRNHGPGFDGRPFFGGRPRDDGDRGGGFDRRGDFDRRDGFERRDGFDRRREIRPRIEQGNED